MTDLELNRRMAEHCGVIVEEDCFGLYEPKPVPSAIGAIVKCRFKPVEEKGRDYCLRQLGVTEAVELIVILRPS